MPNEITQTLSLTMRPRDVAKCAAQHFGTWAVDTGWFVAAVESIRSGVLLPNAPVPNDGAFDSVSSVQQHIAVIAMDGQMTKGGSSFGGCSTVAVRQAVRDAAADPQVNGIMLVVSSPGGTVAGTSDLADDVAAAAESKPTYAYVEDMCCSAAYWVASQCNQVFANSTALVGSIGAMVVLTDTTGKQEKLGVKYTVVSSGPSKGLGADGKIDDEVVAQYQQIVDQQAQTFFDAVAAGRGSAISDLAAVTDGHVHTAQQALTLGLIDRIASLDAAMTAMLQETKMNTIEEFNAFAAANPTATKAFHDTGHAAGLAAGTAAEQSRFVALNSAFPDRPAFVVDQFAKGHDVAKANADFVGVLKAENQQLQQQLTTGAKREGDAPVIPPAAAAASAHKPLATSLAGADAPPAQAGSEAALAADGKMAGDDYVAQERRRRGIN